VANTNINHDFNFDKFQSAFLKVGDKNSMPQEVLDHFTHKGRSLIDCAFQGEVLKLFFLRDIEY
jgi:hypothetical protein